MVRKLKTRIGKARFYYGIKRMLTFNVEKKTELSELQRSVIELAKKILCKKETDLLASPVHVMLYAHWQHITLKISEKDNELIVMNGKYYYHFYLPGEEMTALRKRFYRSISYRQGVFENRFNSHTLENVKAILKEIDECK